MARDTDIPPADPQLTECFVDLVADITPYRDDPIGTAYWNPVAHWAAVHPRWDELIAHIGQDACLRSLYDEFFISTGTGSGGAWDAEDVAAALVSRPWFRIELQGVERTQDNFAAAATGVIDDARKLATGAVVEVPARFMFDGPQIARRFSRDTAFGRVCWTEIGPQWDEGPPLAGLTVFARVPLHLHNVPESDYFYSTKGNQTVAAINRFVSQFQVALLSRGEKGAGLGPPARAMLVQLDDLPLGPANHHLAAPSDSGHGGPVRDIVGVCDMMERYQAVWHNRVETAARRLGQAMSRSALEVAGHTDEDGLVDAMIALESMFGITQELSFRLSIAVAHLLGDTPDDRERIYRRIKKLYGIRSNIVHGNAGKVPDLVHEHRDDAIRIGIDVLEKLLLDRPDLLSVREWEASLILGTARPE